MRIRGLLGGPAHEALHKVRDELGVLKVRLLGAKTIEELGAALSNLADVIGAADTAQEAAAVDAAKRAVESRPSGVRPAASDVAPDQSIRVFCGAGTTEAMKGRLKELKLETAPSEFQKFSTGDAFAIMKADVFNRRVTVIQGTEGGSTGGAYDLPTLVTEALQLAFAARSDGATDTTLLLPKSLDPNARGATQFAKLVAKLAEATGVDKIRYVAELDAPTAAGEARYVRVGPTMIGPGEAQRETARLLDQIDRVDDLGELATTLKLLETAVTADSVHDAGRAQRLAWEITGRVTQKMQSIVPELPRFEFDFPANRHADHRAVVFTGQSNPALAADIADKMGAELGTGTLGFRGSSPEFANLHTRVKDRDVVIVQTTRYSPQAATEAQNSVMGMFAEAMLLSMAAKEGGAKSLTLVLPYMPSVRSDKKDQAGVAAYAAMVAQWIDHLGFGRVVLVEPHDVHIPAMFQKSPVQVISGARVLSEAVMADLSAEEKANLVMVSPDQGANKRTKMLAKELGLHMVTGDKTRAGNDDNASVEALGNKSDVDGKIALVTDDEIATGGTMRQTCEKLKGMGAEKVIVAVAHANMPLEPEARWKAMRSLRDAGADQLLLLDTQPVGALPEDLAKFVRVVSAAPSIAERTDRIPR